MDKIDIILWVLSGGFGLMLVMWHFVNSHLERQDQKIEKLDQKIEKLDQKIEKLDQKLNNFEKDIQQLSTKVAVIESKLVDINSNVSHLMWHHQALPQREAEQ